MFRYLAQTKAKKKPEKDLMTSRLAHIMYFLFGKERKLWASNVLLIPGEVQPLHFRATVWKMKGMSRMWRICIQSDGMSERPLCAVLSQLWWWIVCAVSAVSMSFLGVFTQNSNLLLKGQTTTNWFQSRLQCVWKVIYTEIAFWW